MECLFAIYRENPRLLDEADLRAHRISLAILILRGRKWWMKEIAKRAKRTLKRKSKDLRKAEAQQAIGKTHPQPRRAKITLRGKSRGAKLNCLWRRPSTLDIRFPRYSASLERFSNKMRGSHVRARICRLCWGRLWRPIPG